MFALKRVICQSEETQKDVQTELQVLQVRAHGFVTGKPINLVLTFIKHP